MIESKVGTAESSILCHAFGWHGFSGGFTSHAWGRYGPPRGRNGDQRAESTLRNQKCTISTTVALGIKYAVADLEREDGDNLNSTETFSRISAQNT